MSFEPNKYMPRKLKCRLCGHEIYSHDRQA